MLWKHSNPIPFSSGREVEAGTTATNTGLLPSSAQAEVTVGWSFNKSLHWYSSASPLGATAGVGAPHQYEGPSLQSETANVW